MIDPKLQTCSECGCSWRPGTFHKILMLVRGSYSRRCPQCGMVMRFVLVHHVVKVESKTVKGKRELWKRC